MGLVPKCGACGLYRSCHSPKMAYSGKGQRQVLIVGDSPGATEDEEGRLFVGRAGQFLRETLESLDLDLDRDAWVTNALICHPSDNAVPDAKKIGYCRPNLMTTVAKLKPRVIVLMGHAATSSYLSKYWQSEVGTMERWTGWKIPTSDGWIVPTYHPNFLLRMENSLMNRSFALDLRRAFAIKKDPPVLNLEGKITVLYDPDVINREIAAMSDSEWVAFDYEGNCLKPEYAGARLYSCALSNGERTVSFPLLKQVRNELLRFFASKARKIASNAKFEERWTRHVFGMGAANWGWDTMLAAHCLDNRPGICSLKFQGFVKLGVPTYNEHIEPYLKSGKNHLNRIHQIKLPDLLYYGGMDALLEYKLAMAQRKEFGF